MSADLVFALLGSFDTLPEGTIPPVHRWVLVTLASAANESGQAWPSAETIARRTEYSLRTVMEALTELETAHWISGERRRSDGRQRPTVFTVRKTGDAIQRKRQGRHASVRSEDDSMRPTTEQHAPGALSEAIAADTACALPHDSMRPAAIRNVSTVLRQRARAIYEGKVLAAAGTREGGRLRAAGARGALSPIDASTTGGTAS